MQTVLLSIVIPTYCEAENLLVLIPQIRRELRNASLNAEIIVVDDNSPDATKETAKEMQTDLLPLRLLTRMTERGLSSAVVHGIQNSIGDIVVVMDADLSHPPECIPLLVTKLQSEKIDFVIGSRYVPGALTDDKWGLFRWLNSKVATLLARPLTTVKDPMAGFFALRRETFLRARNLDPIGYKIGLELIVKCNCRSVHEVPIHFKDRLHGESKLTFKEQVNYLRHLKRLYEYKLGRSAKPIQFLMVGFSGAILDLISLRLLLVVFSFTLARGLAIFLAMSWNFLLNRRLTYSYAKGQALLPQYLRFCLGCSLGALVSWVVALVAWDNAKEMLRFQEVAAILGIAVGTIVNYTMSNMFAFAVQDKKFEG